MNILPIIFNFLSQEEKGGLKKIHYGRVWFYSFLLTVLVSCTPLVILTVVNYKLHQRALKDEFIHTMRMMTASSKRSIEYAIEERKDALMFISREYSIKHLKNEDELTRVKNNLESSFRHFIDLSLIDSSGHLITYAGPQNIKSKLKNVDYSRDAWLNETMTRGRYVSDVFSGHRGTPHFTIALKITSKKQKTYILRATLGMEILTSHIPDIIPKSGNDAFIINQKSILQTSSKSGASFLSKVNVDVPPYSDSIQIKEYKSTSGQAEVYSYAYILNSPFILIITKTKFHSDTSDTKFKTRMLGFLIISLLVIILLTMLLFAIFVIRIRKSDKKQREVLHQMEYNSKMASIGRLAAGVAHEINNPLAIINEKAGLLKDYATFNKEYAQLTKLTPIIDSITNAVERGAKITHRLLGFARHIDIKKENVHIPSLVSEVVGFLEKEAIHNNIDIKLDFPDPFPTIISDKGQLQQVFLNLVNNAIQAIEKNGQIQIRAQVKPSTIQIDVTDNGPGISKENRARIFEPFFSTKQKGTGLGLSITYGIINKLKGKIIVESEPGKGTRFVITFSLDKVGQSNE